MFAAILLPLALRADPLHSIAGDAYWHHESNFVFPATLAEFARVGAPQELDGSTTVIAYYARGAGAARMLVTLEVVPVADAAAALAANPGEFFFSIDHAGWRIVVRAPQPDAAAAARVDSLVKALPIDRLGAIDTRCPNAGCGT